MNKETLKALKGSIKKWKNIVADVGEDRGTRNCPLCGLFQIKDYCCVSCPVWIKTGIRYCDKTPYMNWEEHHKNKHNLDSDDIKKINNCPECKKLAQKEFNFLKSLLPEKKINKKRIKNDKI